MTTLANHPKTVDMELIGSRIGRVDPGNFQDQDGSVIDDDNDDNVNDTDEAQYDEPVDEDGDPTGKHDHQQDDNYALGGHVTRSGS